MQVLIYGYLLTLFLICVNAAYVNPAGQEDKVQQHRGKFICKRNEYFPNIARQCVSCKEGSANYYMLRYNEKLEFCNYCNPVRPTSQTCKAYALDPSSNGAPLQSLCT